MTEQPARLRLHHFVVQPVVVWDDGEDLTPGPVIQPQMLTLAGLRDLAENWASTLAELEAQGSDGAPAPAE